jgi:hypothetical protein
MERYELERYQRFERHRYFDKTSQLRLWLWPGLGLGMAAPSRLVVVPLVTKSFLNGSLASRVDFQSWLAMLS